MRNITEIKQLHDLQNETIVYAVIIALVIVGLSYLFANITPYKGKGDNSYIYRRIWLFLTVAVMSLGFWLYNQLYVMDHIKSISFQNQFSGTNFICLLITVFGSLLVSLILMLTFRHSKFGSILGKEKNA